MITKQSVLRLFGDVPEVIEAEVSYNSVTTADDVELTPIELLKLLESHAAQIDDLKRQRLSNLVSVKQRIILALAYAAGVSPGEAEASFEQTFTDQNPAVLHFLYTGDIEPLRTEVQTNKASWLDTKFSGIKLRDMTQLLFEGS